jgi:hypothetical protein
MSPLVQSLIPNVQILVYPLVILNVFHKETIIPHVFISLIKNVMERNQVGFPNSMYPHDETYVPYFGYGYDDIENVPTMWLLIFDPSPNFTKPPKSVLGVTRARIVMNCGGAFT